MPARQTLHVCVAEREAREDLRDHAPKPYARAGGSVPAHCVRRAARCHDARTLAVSAPSGNRLSLAESLGSRGHCEPPHPGWTRAHARFFPMTARCTG